MKTRTRHDLMLARLKPEQPTTARYALKRVYKEQVGWDNHATLIENMRVYETRKEFYKFEYTASPVTPVFDDAYAARLWGKYIHNLKGDTFDIVKLDAENVIPEEYEQYLLTLEMVVQEITLFKPIS